MGKIYVIEQKASGVLGSITNGVTKTGYSHTSMIVYKNKKRIYHCELDAWRKQHYNVDVIKNMKKFLDNLNGVTVVELPHLLTDKQCDSTVEWWLQKRGWTYGFLKLASFILLTPIRKWAINRYARTGKLFNPILGNMIKTENVCSTAVDKSLKEAAFIDCFKETDEDMTYPGLWVQHYGDNIYFDSELKK